MPALLELAERCEQAAGPDRELDFAIFIALNPGLRQYVRGRGGLVHPMDSTDQRIMANHIPPRYATSLDAAMSLVPEGWRIGGLDASIEGRYSWRLIGPFEYDIDDAPMGRAEAVAVSADIIRSLSAAALRARSAIAGGG